MKTELGLSQEWFIRVAPVAGGYKITLSPARMDAVSDSAIEGWSKTLAGVPTRIKEMLLPSFRAVTP